MDLNIQPTSMSFSGTFKFKNMNSISGAIEGTLAELSIDTKDIKSIRELRIDASNFARELRLPRRHDATKLVESIQSESKRFSCITLYNKVKYIVKIAKETLDAEYNRLLNTEGVVEFN